LVEKASGNCSVWGDIIIFAACTGARIGEVSGCRVGDIDTEQWTWTVRRQTTPGPGGLIDKGTKGKRSRQVPLIMEIRELVERRIAATDGTKKRAGVHGTSCRTDHHGRPARCHLVG
jgi:integrase